jgi:hypothetical protein
MSNLFNSELEFSLRILMILNTSMHKKMTIDKLAGIDFITVYGKDFGVSDYNLHGENNLKFSEYLNRRSSIIQAMKGLVLQGYVLVFCFKRGFFYGISDSGKTYCEKLNDDYSIEYLNIVPKAIQYTEGINDRELSRKINSYSLELLRKDNA